MTPRMTTCGTFSVLGVASRISRGAESPELFGRIWKMFESRQREIASVAGLRAIRKGTSGGKKGRRR